MLKERAHVVCAMMLAALIFGLDQLSKEWVLEFFIQTPPPVKITDFFNLVIVMNRGMSFGLLSGLDAVYFMIAATTLIALCVLVWLWRVRDRWLALPLGLVLGGAFGNICDRFRYGAVVDFLDFHVAGQHWPAFNVADSAIVVGVALIAWRSLILPPRETM